MVPDDVIHFLKKTPPFQFLDEADVKAVAASLSMEFYPRDTVVLMQNGPPSEALRIIKKGGVKISMTAEDGGEVVIDYRGEGDTFGFLSLVGKDRVRSNVVTVDDTICYLLGKEMVLKLLDSHLAFTEYFLRSHITRYIDKTYHEMQNKSLFYGGSDRLLFTTKVGDIAAKDPVFATEDTSIEEAARVMSENKISSLVIMNDNSLPTGIMTDRDLREKVVAKGRDVQEPVRNIMSTSLIRVDAGDYCFEVVLKMLRYNIHHVLVIKEGDLKGVITNHDLMMLQGASPLSLTKDIEEQATVEGIIPVSKKINNIVGLLLKDGAKASNITRVTAEISDRLVKKVLEFAERKFGPAPVPYCWIVFGGEGRKEQTFTTEQNNAVVHADPVSERQAEDAKQYFAAFTVFVRDSLVKCGFSLGPADRTAANPLWRQPLDVWKRYFSTWVSAPTPDAVLNVAAVFDFRPVHGGTALAGALKDFLISLLQNQKMFLGHLANAAVRNTPPIGFFKSFAVAKSGEHKDQFNLAVNGIAPLVDSMRICAIDKGIHETSTLERVALLRGKHPLVDEYADELEHAFEFLMLLGIHHQFGQIGADEAPDNFINPDRLSNFEKKSLKDVFQLVSNVQDAVAHRYASSVWLRILRSAHGHDEKTARGR